MDICGHTLGKWCLGWCSGIEFRSGVHGGGGGADPIFLLHTFLNFTFLGHWEVALKFVWVVVCKPTLVFRLLPSVELNNMI